MRVLGPYSARGRRLGPIIPLAVSVFLLLAVTDTASPFAFDHLTADEGLPNNWVQGIFKDSRGFVWIGTQDGLVRYDAGTLTTYRFRPGPEDRPMPLQATRVLLEDTHKILWLGNQGLARFDPVTDRFDVFKADGTSSGPVNVDARAAVEDRRGHIWIAVNGALEEYDPATKTFVAHKQDPQTPNGIPNKSIQSLALDSNDRLWIGTSGGLCRLNLESGRYEAWTHDASELLLKVEVLALQVDRDGTLWAGTLGSGLHHFDPKTETVTRYRHDARQPNSLSIDRVRRLASDGRGTLFIGTENGGLEMLDTKTGVFTHNIPDIDDPRSLNSSSIYELTYDDQGILWIGTFNGGVNILSPPGQRFETIRARRGGLNNSHVMAVLEDRSGDLWIGTDGGGLSRRSARTGVWKYYMHDDLDPGGSLGSNAIQALAEDQKGTLWAGGWDAGISYYDAARDKFVTFRHRADDPQSIPGNHVYVIRPLTSGELLVGTFTGPFLFDPKTHASSLLESRRRPDGTYETDPCHTALEDPDGKLWLSAHGRVDIIDRKSGQIVRVRHDPNDPTSLAPGVPSAMLADSRGNVWVGMQGGLYVFAAGTRKLRRFTANDGLLDSDATGMLEDDSGNLWVSTIRGIAKFNQAVTLPAVPVFLTFDVRDGLQSSEFRRGTAFKSRSSGRMYFGGQRGLNAFLPSMITPNTVPPPVVFTGLKLFNRPVGVGEPGSPLRRAIFETPEITLPYDQSMITIEYAALNYLMPQKNQYSYMLEGLDREWNAVGTQRAATYPVLAPGTYALHVRASNNDGVRNDKGATLRIIIMPPFWKTWWFLLIVLVAMVGGLVYAYDRRVRGMEQRRRALETEVARRTADLQTEIAEHQRTERSLQSQMAERARAEEEARAFALQLAANNETLLQNRDALERENKERRRAEEQAAKERDLLHALMDNIPDLIYFKDRQSRFTRVNNAHATVLGIAEASQAEGKTDADFLSRDFARSSLDDEQQIFATGRPLLGKVEHNDRSRRWLLATKVPIRSENGEITGIVGISKDITERKDAEERLTRDLAAFREIVNAVARGDLTKRGTESDEMIGQIARAVNQMLEGFTSILSEVREAAFSVSASSSEILATSTRIAKGAEFGRGQVHETVTSVEEMAASMAQVSANAEASAAQAQEVLQHVRAGDRAVGAAYEGMVKINSAATETAAKMKSLEQRSREVFQIIELIDEISSQSKLLALNAAIEAAHAGDLGRGFAVVADEVRRLAEKSTNATQQASERIDAIVEETQAALAATQKATREVKEGWALSEQARLSLAEISKLVQDSVEVSLQIASASREQTKATQHVAHAMETIANFTTDSVTGATETSRAVKDLVELSSQLDRAMRQFKIDR